MSPRRSPLRFLLPLVIVGAAGAYWYVLGTTERAAEGDHVSSVRVAYAARADVGRRVSVKAHVEAAEMVTVLPLVSGSVDLLTVDVGDRIAEGDVVARIDPERYQLQLAQADAALRAAERTFTRTRQLFEADATTIQNVDEARANFEAAQSQRDLARLYLEYANVTSPIGGTVLARHATRGDLASPERPIVTIGTIESLIVRASVPEDRYEQFVRGRDSITTTVANNGSVYAASIQTVAPYVQAETRTFEVECEIVDGETLLRPGMSVTVEFELARREDVLTLPYEVRGYGGSIWHVEEGIASKVEVPVLFEGEERFQIPDTFGDYRFVVEGQHFLTEGQSVRVVGDPR